VVSKEGDSQIMVKLPVTNIPRCIGSNAKTPILKHFQFPDMGASGGPSGGKASSITGRRKCLYSRTPFVYGESTSVLERSQHSWSLCRFLSQMIDMSRTDGPSIKDHPKITGAIDPLDWLVGVSGCFYRP